MTTAAYNPAYGARWRYERAHGVLRIIDAAPAALHIATLRGAGWSIRAISGAAGLSPTSILRATTQKRINRITAAKILGVSAEVVPSQPSKQTFECFVPRVGTRRRLEALLFMGWPWSYLLEHYGIRPATAHQQGRWVTRTTHDKVAAAYRDLAHREGPSPRTRRYAQKHGYSGPLAWEDIDLDVEPEDEEATEDGLLDEVAIQRRMDGDRVSLTKAETLELVTRWDASGRSRNECERVTGINVHRYAGALPDDAVDDQAVAS